MRKHFKTLFLFGCLCLSGISMAQVGVGISPTRVEFEGRGIEKEFGTQGEIGGQLARRVSFEVIKINNNN